MSNKHKKTLILIFEKPTRNDISYRKVKSLFKYLGVDITKGNGSRRKININGLVHFFHEPHGSKPFGEYQIEDLREFLIKVGITPNNDTIF